MKRLFEQPDHIVLNQDGQNVSNEFYGILKDFIQKVGPEVNPNDLQIILQRDLNLICARYGLESRILSEKNKRFDNP